MTYELTSKMYYQLANGRKAVGAVNSIEGLAAFRGLETKAKVIEYLNATAGFLGEITELSILD